MIVLVTGASHTGKTLLAQRLLESRHFSCLSIDLLKMGLIRSGNTALTPEDDEALEACLWPIVREIIKTAIENRQHLIVECCYIPFHWREDFSAGYLREIRFCCLVMSRNYIERHFDLIRQHADAIERRVDDAWCTMEHVLTENARYEELCARHGFRAILIDESYRPDAILEQCEREIDAPSLLPPAHEKPGPCSL